MITLRSNNYSNLLQFRSRNAKKTDNQSTNEHKTKRSVNNKYTTGAIATTAFIAGLGANKLVVPTDTMARTKTEMYSPARNNAEETSSKDISWEEATAQQRTQQRKTTTTPQKTRPANSDYWYYTKRNTVTGENGEKYTEISQYVVHEQQDLLTRTYKNAQGKVIQKEEYNRYVSVPLYEKTTLENGKLYQEKEYEKFNYDSRTPTKGAVKVARDDGSTDTYDVDFQIQMQLNESKHTNPPEKKQNNNSNNSSSGGTGLGDILYDQIFGK